MESIDHRALRDAAAQDFDISMRLTWQVIEEERRLHNRVVGLGRGNAEERMALLLDLHGRLALTGQIEVAAVQYDCPMTQQQVGAEQVSEVLDAAIAARRRAAEQEHEPAPSRVAPGILSVLGNSMAALPIRARAVDTAKEI